MGFELDKIDLRILYELDCDSRGFLSAIGKKIRKSPQYVKYRLERFKEERIIQSVSVFWDFPSDTIELAALISLRGGHITEERLLLDFLFKLPQTYRLYFCDGAFQILGFFVLDSWQAAFEIKKKLLAQFPSIESIQFVSKAHSEIYTKKYLVDAHETDTLRPSHATAPLEPLQQQIIEQIQKNPFAALLEIASALGVSYDKVKYVFKNAKPYRGTRLVLSESVAKKSVLLLDFTGDIKALLDFASLSPHIAQADILFGTYNCALFFEGLNETELTRIVKEVAYRFRDQIAHQTRLEIINTYKYQWFG